MGISIRRGARATVTFSTPQQVVISHVDDSIAIGDGTTVMTNGGIIDNSLAVIQTNTLVKRKYDSIVPSVTATEDIFVYKTGGIAGTTVATVTITYTDSTKATMSSTVVT